MTASLWNLAAYSIQLAALVGVAVLCTTALRIRIPRQALRFWQTVMAIALLVPLAQPRHDVSPGLVLVRSMSAAVLPSVDGSIVPSGLNLVAIVLLILAAGIVLRLLWLGAGLLRLRSIVARATSDDSLTAITSELKASLGVAADVGISVDLEGPATVGARRPVVLLPPAVLGMSAAVQRAIICHELVHVRRRDWFQTIAEEIWCAVLWFHPAARIVASRLSLARETMVDELTILHTRDRRAYAEALLAFSNPQPHVIGATPFIGRRTLSQRISLIAEEAPMSRRPALFRAAVAVAATIAITAVAVARFPMSASAQEPQVYEAGNGVSLPVVVHEVKPQYTAEAMQQKIQGRVWLKVVIGETGDVTDVQVERSLDAEYGLDRKATEAAYQWKFKPATKEGKAVAFRVTVEMTFTLKK